MSKYIDDTLDKIRNVFDGDEKVLCQILVIVENSIRYTRKDTINNVLPTIKLMKAKFYHKKGELVKDILDEAKKNDRDLNIIKKRCDEFYDWCFDFLKCNSKSKE